MSVSPEARLAALEVEVQTLKARLASLESGTTAAATLPEVDIDGEHGDPVVRKDPPRWKGQSYATKPFSQCEPKYLRTMAGFLQWRAAKERAEPAKAKYAKRSMLDAARALAWAARKETEASRYGTSGAGASAKHAVTPEPDDDNGEGDVWAAQFDNEEPPF